MMNKKKSIFIIFTLLIILAGCSSKIERTIVLTPIQNYEESDNRDSFIVVNNTGYEGIVTTGSGPKLEISYLVPDVQTAVKNRLIKCLSNPSTIKRIDILESKFDFRNMLNVGSVSFILKLQTKYFINGHSDNVVYQGGFFEKDIPIGFLGVNVNEETNKFFALALEKICMEMNNDINEQLNLK